MALPGPLTKVGPMSTLHHRFAGRIALLVTAALVAIVLPPTTAQAAGGDATFVGHGWGHGRGMGQYGALGYAVDYGWSSAQILDHFYGGTVAGTAGNPEMTVELSRMTGRDTIVTGNGLAINRVAAGAVAVLIRRTASGTFQAYGAPGCGGPWKVMGGPLGSGLTISTSGTQGVLGNLVSACEATGERAYRGSFSVVDQGGTQMTINHLPTESYLRGVVPRESPAYWGSLGGGKGLQALRAQAVAARSYALASIRSTFAHTCDTTACQVYDGAGFKTGSTWTVLEQASTDTAISGTAGVVRRKSGAIARTEFSSSTGGYSAGGAFPAVVDAGDSVAYNPNHTWVTSLAFSTVASQLGTGTIRSMAVTARNGFGVDGGRATNVRVVSTAGVVRDFTGNQVRSALGLKSDWFSVSGITPAAADQVVTALYRDVLGRAPDPAGLASWRLAILTTGNAQVVARSLASSGERMNALVVAQYKLALHRTPDPGGLVSWVRRLGASGGGLSDLQIGLYGSPESLQTLGGGNLSTWVGALYVALLGRTASASERQHWVDQAMLRGRASVVASIARSDEAGMRRLTAYYTTFLQRGVDPSGRRSLLPLMAGRGDFVVPVTLGSSPEYWNRAQSRTF
jgi:SpoIID/LytB domain protein